MAAWIGITPEHLDDYLVSAQMSALRSAALGEMQDDPFDRIMPDRCAYIRNRISRRIVLSASPLAIPPELKTCACMLIIEALSVRLSMAIELTEDQRTMIRRAYSDLDVAGSDEFPISEPDDPIRPAVQAGGGVSLVSHRPRTETGGTMQGL